MKYFIFVIAVFTSIDLARSQLVFNTNTELYWNPATQIQYVPHSNTPITSLAQLGPIFGPLTLAEQQYYFPYLFQLPPQIALSSLPINEDTGIPWDPATGIEFNPTTGEPITTVCDVAALYSTVPQYLLEAYFPYLFPTIVAATITTAAPIMTTTASIAPVTTTTKPQAPVDINPNTGLPWDPVTGIQYNPFTNLPILTVAVAEAFFPGLSQDILQIYFPYLFPDILSTTVAPSTTSPISSLPTISMEIPWDVNIVEK
jgi:hypothetical protein